MPITVSEHIFTGATTPIASYDSTKTSIGTFITQNTGDNATDKWVGPHPVAVGRPLEVSGGFTQFYPHAIPFSDSLHWIFAIVNSTSGTGRSIGCWTFDTVNWVFGWKGFVTVTLNTAATHTTRGFRMTRDLYSTGTASVSGTAVTGAGGAAWQTARIAAGARIGFGSTDPTQITTWYQISAIGGETSITLVENPGTIASGPYVIEELRAIIVTTNSTAANGGLFVAKGLNFDIFDPLGTTVSAATNTDNLRATYWLANAATVTNTVAGGVGLLDKENDQTHYIFVSNGTTTMQYFKYNLRASLSGLASGKSTSAFVHATGVSGTLTGTASQTNSHRQGFLTHVEDGAECIFFATTTRIYYSKVADLTSGNTDFLSGMMSEVPPGGIVTYAATAAMSSSEISHYLDRLIITTNATGRVYLTQFNTEGNQFDDIFLIDSRQIDASNAEAGTTPHPSISGQAVSVWSEGGIFYMLRNVATVYNQLYAIPLGADWAFAAAKNQRAITPSLSTLNAVKLMKVYVNAQKCLGSSTLGVQPEPYRVYARTSGINDNSGSWTLIDETGDISGLTPTNEIQFMFEFRVAGFMCVPARIFSCSVLYEDGSTDSHFQPSVNMSSVSSKIFAWRFGTAFGGDVPDLRIRLYDVSTESLLVDDDTASPDGTFEKSVDGGDNWSAWDNSDKGNETTYLRYTPSSLGDGIVVRALLTILE